MQADLTIERAQAEFDITGQNVEHEHNLVELAAQTRNRGAA